VVLAAAEALKPTPHILFLALRTQLVGFKATMVEVGTTGMGLIKVLAVVVALDRLVETQLKQQHILVMAARE
jgi:hypothetical protein